MHKNIHPCNIYNASGISVLYVQEELNDVTAVCEVDGMEKPLVLNFCCKAKSLSVSYSLPQTSTNWYSPKHMH